MTISRTDLKILFQRSGNRCAYPNCGKELIWDDGNNEHPFPISEIAHIVAQQLDGPRGNYPLTLDKRDEYSNLILLCEEHHHLIDAKPASYPVEMLRRFKEEHERRIAEATGRAFEGVQKQTDERKYITETLFSTLLPVSHLPKYVYSASCKYADGQEKEANEKVIKTGDATPFIIRGGKFYCFNNLRLHDNPFKEVIADPATITRHHSRDWWTDPDRMQWYVQLLNRTLNKITGRKGLQLDRDHKRYYFQPETRGKPREITYTPLNQAKSTRNVVWQPVTKKTGLGKSYWYHLAVALRFYHVSSTAWCLSIRPEMHITRDGISPYPSEKIGSRITRKKSRTFNYNLLADIQFWRDYLSDGTPRITISFGDNQALVISNTMLEGEITWPGMPEEHAKPFKNIAPNEDLFTWSDFQQLVGVRFVGAEEDDYEEDDEE